MRWHRAPVGGWRALFELARLEHGEVRLEWEVFALPELLQDVLQKFELAAQARGQQLHAAFPPGRRWSVRTWAWSSGC